MAENDDETLINLLKGSEKHEEEKKAGASAAITSDQKEATSTLLDLLNFDMDSMKTIADYDA